MSAMISIGLRRYKFSKNNAIKRPLWISIFVKCVSFSSYENNIVKKTIFPDVLIILAHFGRINSISGLNLTIRKEIF